MKTNAILHEHSRALWESQVYLQFAAGSYLLNVIAVCKQCSRMSGELEMAPVINPPLILVSFLPRLLVTSSL